MRKRILKLLVPVLCTLVLFVGVAGTSHAASHRSAPARALTCTGDSVETWSSVDEVSLAGDTVYIEADVRMDSCGRLRPYVISEVDAGCIFGTYCDSYKVSFSLSKVNTTPWTLLQSGGDYSVPNDGNYHGYGGTDTTYPCGTELIAEIVVNAVNTRWGDYLYSDPAYIVCG